MNVFAVLGILLITLFLAVFIKNYRAEYSLLLGLAASAMVFIWVISTISPIFSDIKNLFLYAGIKEEYFSTLLKAVGISVATGFCADLCKDNGQNSLAVKAEFAGKAALLVLALPYCKDLLEITMQILKE